MVQREQQNEWNFSGLINTINKDDISAVKSLYMMLSNDFRMIYIDAALIASQRQEFRF